MQFKTLDLMWAHAKMLGYKHAAFNKDKSCFAFKGEPYLIESVGNSPEHPYWVYIGDYVLLGQYVGDETHWKNSLN